MSSSSKWAPPAATDDTLILEAMQQIALTAGVPTVERDLEWTRQEIRALVTAQGSPQAFDPIWSTVLPMWRLKALEGRLERESKLRGPWQIHALAWMVSVSRRLDVVGGRD
jgi:hypothetical protein